MVWIDLKKKIRALAGHKKNPKGFPHLKEPCGPAFESWLTNAKNTVLSSFLLFFFLKPSANNQNCLKTSKNHHKLGIFTILSGGEVYVEASFRTAYKNKQKTPFALKLSLFKWTKRFPKNTWKTWEEEIRNSLNRERKKQI